MTPKPKSSLEADFHNAMHEIYRLADKECHYRPTYFLRMLAEHGGLATAKILLAKQHVSEGFTKLAELGRLDLSMESLVLENKWRSLFTDRELAIARNRLKVSGQRV